MFGLKGRPTPKEIAQGFLVSLESENPLTDIEQALIQKYRIDDNKYRWEARYLEVAATEYAFFTLSQGDRAAKVAAVRDAYWGFWKDLSSKNEEGAFIVAQCRARLKTYTPAIDKDASGGIGLAVATEFAHQFNPIPDGALPLLLNAGTAVFDASFRTVTEVLTTLDIKV